MFLSISCIYIVFSKKGLLLQVRGIFVKIRPKIEEGSNFKVWVLKRSFNQITLKYLMSFEMTLEAIHSLNIILIDKVTVSIGDLNFLSRRNEERMQSKTGDFSYMFWLAATSISSLCILLTDLLRQALARRDKQALPLLPSFWLTVTSTHLGPLTSTLLYGLGLVL